MTDEALKLLSWILSHAPCTKPKILSGCIPTHRAGRKLELQELLDCGAVVRDQYGWYRPAVLVLDRTLSIKRKAGRPRLHPLKGVIS